MPILKKSLITVLCFCSISVFADDNEFNTNIDNLFVSKKINIDEYNNLYRSYYGSATPKDSAENQQVSLDELNFDDVASFDTYEALVESFKYMRDYDSFEQKIPFIATGDSPFEGDWYQDSPDLDEHFPRRLSWLAMHTGCETRATLGGKVIEEKYGIKLKKLFVFGNLSADAGQFSPNPSEDIVRWGMHNAVLAKVGNDENIYVLDPAINPDAPTLLDDWYTAINFDQEDQRSFTGSVCNLETLSQSDDCESTDESAYGDALERLEGLEDGYSGYLNEEWRSVQVRQNDPYEVLGNNPPWDLNE